MLYPVSELNTAEAFPRSFQTPYVEHVGENSCWLYLKHSVQIKKNKDHKTSLFDLFYITYCTKRSRNLNTFSMEPYLLIGNFFLPLRIFQIEMYHLLVQ